VFFYSNGIFKGAGVPDEQIPYAVIGTNAVNVLMTIVSVRSNCSIAEVGLFSGVCGY
jgi:hypothetical protein